MEKGKWKKRLTALAVLAVLIAGIVVILRLRSSAAYVKDVSDEKLRWAYQLLAGALNSDELKYTDYLMLQTEDMGTSSAEAFPEEGKTPDAFEASAFSVLPYDGSLAVLRYNETAEYRVTLTQGGIYTLYFDYLPAGDSYLDHTASITINGETQYQELKTIDFPLYWRDETNEILTDRYGDQIAPGQERVIA